MHGDGEIGRQGPRRRRPDGDARFIFQRAGRDREFHIRGGVLAVLIFHLGFGQRSLRAGAPEDRLLRFVNEPLLHENGEGAEDVRFVGGIEREVGMLPIAEDAEAFELLALDIDKLARELLGTLPHFQRREAARFLHHLELDRQAVAIPARHIGRAKTEHGLRFHDQILQNFVQRGAHVDIAVGERRAIVQHERLRLPPRLLDLLVKAGGLPTLQDFRLARGQARLHRELRLREVERILVIGGHRGAATLTLKGWSGKRRGAGTNARRPGVGTPRVGCSFARHA